MAHSNSKKKNNNKKFGKRQKKITLIILSCVVALTVLCSVVFGFKLYAYGKDVTVVYAVNGGTISASTQVVEVCKSYTLKTPIRSDKKFLYWSTDGTEKGKVKSSGLWLASTKKQVVLYAVWGKSSDSDWTSNY